MTEQEFLSFYNKNVIVTLEDNTSISGHVYTFTRSGDSDNGIASISLESSQGYVEIMQNEVKKITITP
ncbi:MAG: hypothetical protein J5982_03360 [Bacilli bacterium]|nr:hypothetical protein [Bacilli bacterium]